MLRKTTALTLLWLMTMVVATSQPGLRYCLCLETAFVGDCDCVAVLAPEQCVGYSNDLTAPCACQFHVDHREFHASSCSGCAVDLFIGPNHFVDDVASRDFTLDKPGVIALIKFCSGNGSSLLPPLRARVHGIRGSPPPLVVNSSVPLRVRYSVFLV